MEKIKLEYEKISDYNIDENTLELKYYYKKNK